MSSPAPQLSEPPASELLRELQLTRLETRAGFAEVRAGVAELRNDVSELRRSQLAMFDELAAFRREYNDHYHPGEGEG